MEELQQQQRGRSSSAGHHSNHNHSISHSRSPQRYSDHAAALRLDPAVNPSTFTTGAFNTTPLTSSAITESQYSYSTAAYLEAPYQALQYERLGLQSNSLQDQQLGQTYNQEDLSPSSLHNPSNLDFEQSGQQLTSGFLDSNAPIDFGGYTQKVNHLGAQDQAFDGNLMLDPQLQGTCQPSHHTMNPADLMSSNMSSPHLSTPPNLLQPDSQASPAQQSPSSGPFYSPGHSRQASLDPSAAYGHGQAPQDWTGMLTGVNFHVHRRTPSEHSDVSSSVAPSPFLPQQDSFDSFDGNSPMLNAQQDNSLYQDALGIEQFSLSEPQQQQHQQQQRMTPAHSPYASPRIRPHEGLGISQQESSFILAGGMNTQFNGGPRQDMYGNHTIGNLSIQNIPDYPQRNGSSDMGQATQMAPPEINVEFAPPSRQHVFDHPKLKADADALSPPRGSKSPFSTRCDHL
ncbi:MAG: hypothetical protein LQ347_003510 [Umbilicaria vellea]|nr:MAG: hypothetical protein LQ347_003510 [Umbilicaria vellea]